MTDAQPNDVGRLDLRALDAAPDAAREDIVVAATLVRLTRHPVDLAALLRLRRRIGVAAAVLAAVAATTLLVTRSRAPASGDAMLMTWARNGHIPTNGELLAVYHGYQP